MADGKLTDRQRLGQALLNRGAGGAGAQLLQAGLKARADRKKAAALKKKKRKKHLKRMADNAPVNATSAHKKSPNQY